MNAMAGCPISQALDLRRSGAGGRLAGVHEMCEVDVTEGIGRPVMKRCGRVVKCCEGVVVEGVAAGT